MILRFNFLSCLIHFILVLLNFQTDVKRQGFMVEYFCSCQVREQSVAAKIDRGELRWMGRQRQQLPLVLCSIVNGKQTVQTLLVNALIYLNQSRWALLWHPLFCLYTMSMRTLSKKAPVVLQHASFLEDLSELKLVGSFLGSRYMPMHIFTFHRPILYSDSKGSWAFHIGRDNYKNGLTFGEEILPKLKYNGVTDSVSI